MTKFGSYDLQVATAFDFYKKHMTNAEKNALYEAYNFRRNGSVSSQDWELFAAILFSRAAKGGYGSDLTGIEVKSAKSGSSFEYQYHRNTGIEKLLSDMTVDHIFISYDNMYADVVVRHVVSESFRVEFKAWESELLQNYGPDSKRQRFRKSIPYGRVLALGTIVLEIKAGELVYPPAVLVTLDDVL